MGYPETGEVKCYNGAQVCADTKRLVHQPFVIDIAVPDGRDMITHYGPPAYPAYKPAPPPPLPPGFNATTTSVTSRQTATAAPAQCTTPKTASDRVPGPVTSPYWRVWGLLGLGNPQPTSSRATRRANRKQAEKQSPPSPIWQQLYWVAGLVGVFYVVAVMAAAVRFVH